MPRDDPDDDAAAAAGGGDDALPAVLRDWYAAQGVGDVTSLAQLRPKSRYVRIPKRFEGDTDAIAASLARACGAPAERVPWLDGFLRLPGGATVRRTEAYEARHIFPMDAASGAAVLAVGAEPGEDVLDLCCCPGAKLCALADAVGPEGSATGVDVDGRRLAVARQLADAHAPPGGASGRVRLFRADGASFAGPASADEAFYDSAAADRAADRGGRRRRNASARGREAKRLKTLAATAAAAPTSYDRVLVDAECSTDGSAAHVGRMVAGGRVDELFSAARTAALTDLQGRLLANGFARLKDGGTLVYATCSLAAAQNEGVVAAFLKREPRAALEPLPFAAGAPGGLPHTRRFTAANADTSGLFVARIAKRQPPESRCAIT